MTTESTSTRAKLLARYLRSKGIAKISHTQALEALAHADNFSSFNIAQAKKHPPEAPVSAKTSDPQGAIDLLRQAIAQGLTVANALSVFTEKRSAAEALFLKEAQEHHGRDGELEFDDNAVVSISEDRGAYVMGWTWIYLSDIETPDSLAEAFKLPYAQVGFDLPEEYVKVAKADLELNEEALTQWHEGAKLPADLWLVRTRSAVGARESVIQLTVAQFEALTFDPDGSCFQGVFNGEQIQVEFYPD